MIIVPQIEPIQGVGRLNYFDIGNTAFFWYTIIQFSNSPNVLFVLGPNFLEVNQIIYDVVNHLRRCNELFEAQDLLCSRCIQL